LVASKDLFELLSLTDVPWKVNEYPSTDIRFQELLDFILDVLWGLCSTASLLALLVLSWFSLLEQLK